MSFLRPELAAALVPAVQERHVMVPQGLRGRAVQLCLLADVGSQEWVARQQRHSYGACCCAVKQTGQGDKDLKIGPPGVVADG